MMKYSFGFIVLSSPISQKLSEIATYGLAMRLAQGAKDFDVFLTS
jgi:hypothetical protein